MILGISAYYHDAAAITANGQIIAAAQEEWFSRVKHDPGFPAQSIRFVLEQSGAELAELEAIAFYDKPFLKFERLIETYLRFCSPGCGVFCQSHAGVDQREVVSEKNAARRTAGFSAQRRQNAAPAFSGTPPFARRQHFLPFAVFLETTFCSNDGKTTILRSGNMTLGQRI